MLILPPAVVSWLLISISPAPDFVSVAPPKFRALLNDNTLLLPTSTVVSLCKLTIAWTALATFVILKLVSLLVTLRVNEEDETVGLDITAHEESGYNL